tara:strand:+ start:929 stop:1048 length:120 start_codon:yes stop_codon:yes gene_type:complete
LIVVHVDDKLSFNVVTDPKIKTVENEHDSMAKNMSAPIV